LPKGYIHTYLSIINPYAYTNGKCYSVQQLCNVSYQHLSVLLNSQNTDKFANMPSLFDAQMHRSFHLQGASSPDPLIRGSAHRPHCGLCPIAPIIGLRFHARHVPPFPPLVRTRSSNLAFCFYNCPVYLIHF